MIFPYFPIVLHEFGVAKPKEVKFSNLLSLVDRKKRSEAKEFISQIGDKRKSIHYLLKAKPKKFSECAEEIREYLQLVQGFKITPVKEYIQESIYFTWRSGLQNSKKKRRIQFKSLLFEEIMMSWLYGICLINSCRQILKRAASVPSNERVMSPSRSEEYHLHVVRALRLAGGVFSSLSLDLIPSFHREQNSLAKEKNATSPTVNSPSRRSPFPLRKKSGKKLGGFSAFSESAIFTEDPFSSYNDGLSILEEKGKIADLVMSPVTPSSMRDEGSQIDGELRVSFFEIDPLAAYSMRYYCTSAAQMIKLYSISTGMLKKRESVEKSYSLSNSPQTPQNIARRRRRRANRPITPFLSPITPNSPSFMGKPSVSSSSSSGGGGGGGEDSSVWIANVAVKIYHDLDECFGSLRTLHHKKKYLDKKMEVDHRFWLNVSQYRIIYRAVTLQQMAIHHYNVDNFRLCCRLISLSLRQIKEIQVFRVVKRNQMFLREIEKFVYSIANLERKYYHENKIFFHQEILKEIPKRTIPLGKTLITIKPHIIDSDNSDVFKGYLKDEFLEDLGQTEKV